MEIKHHPESEVVLTYREYKNLQDRISVYTNVTKTSADKGVRNFLKFFGFTCWHDDPEFAGDPDIFCCSTMCPLYQSMGDDLADRLCTRYKVFSK